MKFYSISLSDAFMLFNKSYLKWKNALVPKISNSTLIEDYRTWAKKSISRYSTDNTNFEMLVNLSLFTFAFSQMVWFRYHENSFSYFLKNTFPGVSLPCQTLSWDTFSNLLFQNQNLKLKQVDMYPESILISTQSDKYFNQKLLDIGVLPINQEKIGSIGSTSWSSVFSYRLQAKNNFFTDQIPSKLDSNLYPIFSFSKSNLKVSDFPLVLEENTLFLKTKKPVQKSQTINQRASETGSLIFDKPLLATFIPTRQEFCSRKKVKYPQYFEIFPQDIDEVTTQGKSNAQKFFFLKAFVPKNLNKVVTVSATFPASSEKGTKNEINQNCTSKKFQFISKKAFFSKEVLNLSSQEEIKPFLSLHSLFQTEKEGGQMLENFVPISLKPVLTPLKSTSEQLFLDVCSQEILNSLESLSGPKPNLWLGSRFRSGFLYPDNGNVEFLMDQSTYQKNPIISFYKKSLKQTSLSAKPLIPNFSKKNISPPKILPIEVIFHGNISRSQINEISLSQTSTLGENKKKQIFGFKYRPISLIFENETYYQGDGLLKNKLTSDVDLSNKKEVNKWAKKYFSQNNFLTDRKDSFFGYSVKKGHIANPKKILPESTRLDQNFKKKEEKILEFLVPVESFKDITSPRDKLRLNPRDPDSPNIKIDYSVQYFKRLPVILCNENWQIPYIKKDEWETITQKVILDSVVSEEVGLLKQGLNETISDSVLEIPHRVELSIPLLRIAVPTLTNCISQPWPLTFVDYQPDALQMRFQELINTADFTLQNVKNQGNKVQLNHSTFKVINHSLPWSRSQWTADLVSQRHFGNLYKRETTIFPKTPGKNILSLEISESGIPLFLQACFNDHWEPFTLNSWMILNQFCFVLFSLKVCQSCYQEYGKEVLLFLIEALESLGVVDEGLKDDFQLEKSGAGFRVLKSLNKRFKDVAGIDGILPDLSEIVWFLRNSGRSFKMGKVIPKGVLFIGPPGTGKTFLASAIAGEAEVPVLVQSGSTLSVPEQPGKGAERLKNLFYQARQLAPCIIFIDEIDTLGEKRQHISGNPMGHDGMFEALGSNTGSTSTFEMTPEFSQNVNQFVPESIKSEFHSKQSSSIGDESSKFFGAEQSSYAKDSLPTIEKQGDQLNILTQFLVEMDGLESRQGIIVIGATNRPGVLDPAFTRPGRFDKIIKLEFPAKQKRIEILKLYSQNLGIDPRISWDYLANRTDGCSAADLSAAMNESSIQAILKDTTHTVETIEQGLDFIQSSTRQKPYLSKLTFTEGQDQQVEDKKVRFARKKNGHDPFFIKRLAYSQAGKAVLFTLLPQHPPCIFLNLWAPLQCTKSENKLRKSDSVSKPFSTCFQLENILIGSYAGKACELLGLFKNSHRTFLKSGEILNYVPSIFTLWESDLNREDTRQGTLLAQSMISKWYFYSKKISLKKWNSIITNQNDEDTSLFKQLTVLTEMDPILESSEKNWQKVSLRAWWQNNVTQQTGSLNTFSRDWYRIYLADPEQNLRNEEFVPADEYYHNGERSLNLLQQSKKSSIYWNDFYPNHRDSLYQALVMSSFNRAFSLLDQNREIIDSFADYLLRYETIRENEISSIFLQFQTDLKTRF